MQCVSCGTWIVETGRPGRPRKYCGRSECVPQYLCSHDTGPNRPRLSVGKTTVYPARLVMAAKLGRPLTKGEYVKYHDGNRWNLSPDNLYLSKSPKVKGE